MSRLDALTLDQAKAWQATDEKWLYCEQILYEIDWHPEQPADDEWDSWDRYDRCKSVRIDAVENKFDELLDAAE